MVEPTLDEIVSRMTWRTPGGEAIENTSSLRVGESLKDIEDRSRQVRAAELGGRPLVLKLRTWHGLKRRWLATRGRSRIVNEMNMMRLAANAGLRVATLVAHGCGRRFGLVNREGLLFDRLVGWVTLRQIGLRHFKEQNAALLDAMMSTLVAHVAAVRRAGLADSDCGGNNLMVAGEDALGAPPVWIDLETVRRAGPDDAEGTMQTCAAALMSWWEHGSRDESRFVALWRQLMSALPEPAGGWGQLITPLNALLQDRGAKQVRHARSNRLPPALRV